MPDVAALSDTNIRPRAAPGRARQFCQYARRVIRLLLFAFVGLAATPAYADLSCGVTGITLTIAAGVISIPANAAVGTTVLTLAPSPLKLNCILFTGLGTSGTLISNLSTVTAPASGFDDVYPTSVAGLGVRYTFAADPNCSPPTPTMKNKAIAIPCLITGPADSKTQIYTNMTVSPSLVVTSAVKPGASTLTSVPLVNFTYTLKEASGSWSQGSLYTGAASGSLSVATCSVQTPANAITLPNVATRSLASVGATAGSQAFGLKFACASGAQVSIVITDAVDPTNRSNVLKLGAESTAKGIGVQILKNGSTPVLFGPDAVGQSVQNQWLIGASPNGLLELPLSAQYIRTGNLSAGSIKALATFTMSYQ